MSKHSSIMWLFGVAALFVVACGGRGGSNKLVDSRDSLSYVIGMNIAYNIMQMDSTVSADAVMAGVEDGLRGRERMTLEDARTYLLGYMNYDVYDRVRLYEEQYIADLVASDGDMVRSEKGFAYKVGVLGDMNTTIATERDTVAITYRATNLAGEEVDLASERSDTLRVQVRELIDGLQAGVRLVGEGGSLTLWLPSSMAYGSAGDTEKGIKANEMLRYEVQVVEIKRRR